ncbi:MAG: ABC transporter ATP-binding protein [bacterium]|nr:ABC transporter ATP-binding protein [bacterium]
MRSNLTSEISETPIIVKNLTKKFVLWHQKENSLKSTFINLVRSRKLTRESFTPLDNISFSVKKGETLGVIGHNGSGKTTLLRVLAGITKPTNGIVTVDGRVSTLFELGTGFHAELSGRENIFLNGTILGLTRKEIEQKYDKIVEFSELGKFIDSPIKHYSSGMQMRLAFSVAISVNPEVLLVDEVLAVGDSAFQAKSYSAFQDFKQRGTTIVFVTHDLGAVNANCDRAILLDKGKIVAEGNPAKVVERYRSDVDQAMYGEKSKAPERESGRFGDGQATVESVWTENRAGRKVAVIESGDEIVVKIKYKFHYKATEPIFGLIVDTRDGRPVLLDNTLWRGIKTGNFKKGSTTVVTFRFPNNLERGYYRLTPTVAKTATLPHDHRTGMAEFFSQQPYLTGGMVNPTAVIELEGGSK